MSRPLIILYVCVISLVSCQNNDKAPKPPAELKSIPPPPVDDQAEEINYMQDRRSIDNSTDIQREIRGV